eukprot:TRINITY_DN11599_c0_g5_i1.p1 TRINITY_DN11599_c0_g5~~TRINITY_DN11599_c0_g5_i1.p1  ORF type:complete len:736 (+),score=142.48 TRINITY_DN11599_c0_g5_i1:44-2251(+)
MVPPPAFKPVSACFGSGPCKKPPGFNEFRDKYEILGRSHRAKPCKALINKCMEDTLRILGCPEGYKAGILPGSDTGAVEMILWSILGDRPVDVFHWETFGSTWAKDLQTLNVKHNSYKAEYGQLPDFSNAKSENDILFPWNGTTSGVRVPNGDWIPADREGVTICDATSAVFSMEMPWEKLDITTFSWQKALGGEAGHGVVILSPKGLQRIRDTQPRPLPKCLSLAGKTIDEICAGNVINTVSMMCVADYAYCLEWVSEAGGLTETVARTNRSFQAIADFVDNNDWLSFLCSEPAFRSTTSVCLKYGGTAEKLYSILSKLEKDHIAYDIKHYRDAPVGIRIWCGATVEADDVSKLLQCLKCLHEEGDTATLVKPNSPNFGSGPCAKPPTFNWYYDAQKVLGRSHRASICKNLINSTMEDTLRILGCPEGYKAGILPGSDTGAVEMILWSILGDRPVDVFHWETFGSTWAKDLQTLNVKHNSYKAEYGQLPDFSNAKSENDILFPWNGTTSGVRVPNGDWIPADREGVTICDATSAVFSMEMPWEKLDITTFSWQKALGGEAAHGVVILSPKGLERLRSASISDRPLPKILKLNGKVIDEVCAGNVINTISMMCVEDYSNCLRWVKSIGGVSSTIARTNANFAVVKKFTDSVEWLSMLSEVPENCSTTSVCLKSTLSADQLASLFAILSQNQVAYDIASYRAAPSGIRIWCGASVDTQDVCMLMDWLEYAHSEVTK